MKNVCKKIIFVIFSLIYFFLSVYLIFMTEINDLLSVKIGYGLIALYCLSFGIILILKNIKIKLSKCTIGFLLICLSTFFIYWFFTSPSNNINKIPNEYIINLENQVMKISFKNELKNLNDINSNLERIANKNDIFFDYDKKKESADIFQSIILSKYEKPYNLSLKIDLYLNNEFSEFEYKNKLNLKTQIIQENKEFNNSSFFLTKEVFKNNDMESSMVIRTQNMIINITKIKDIQNNIFLKQLLDELVKINH